MGHLAIGQACARGSDHVSRSRRRQVQALAADRDRGDDYGLAIALLWPIIASARSTARWIPSRKTDSSNRRALQTQAQPLIASSSSRCIAASNDSGAWASNRTPVVPSWTDS